jgi:hypothetical protein
VGLFLKTGRLLQASHGADRSAGDTSRPSLTLEGTPAGEVVPPHGLDCSTLRRVYCKALTFPLLPVARCRMRGAVAGASCEACFSGRTCLQAFHVATAAATTRRQRRSLPWRTVRAEAAEPGAREQPLQQPAAGVPPEAALQPAAAQRQGPDPYQLAGQRLRSLLSGVGDGEVSSRHTLLRRSPPWLPCWLAVAAVACF